MGYWVKCSKCDQYVWATNIVNLIEVFTDNTFGKDGGFLRCKYCNNDAYIYRSSKLQEKGEVWERYIKCVVRVPSSPTYSPYIMLTSSKENGIIEQVHFGYFKDTRKEKGGKLKHGAGPGGAPVFDDKEFYLLIKRLLELGFIKLSELEKFIDKRANSL